MGTEILEILLFAAIAGFLIWRLRSVLGRRTGHESAEPDRYPANGERSVDALDNVVHLPSRGLEETPALDIDPDSPLAKRLSEVQEADRSFDPAGFVDGARTAFEMIVDGFAAGDLSQVEPFLNEDVHQNFADAIAARQEAGETLETTLVSFRSVEILDARLNGRTALITIKFVTEQTSMVKDSEGRIVDGDPSAISEITDIWTFSRDTRSRDPNWVLVETASEN